jgi:hypothetical protein
MGSVPGLLQNPSIGGAQQLQATIGPALHTAVLHMQRLCLLGNRLGLLVDDLNDVAIAATQSRICADPEISVSVLPQGPDDIMDKSVGCGETRKAGAIITAQSTLGADP